MLIANEREKILSQDQNPDVEALPLCEGDDYSRNIFSGDVRYVIPLYQREFAWGTHDTSGGMDEIVQLMDDIAADRPSNRLYYLGSLVVARREEDGSLFEVIDGQQRLTALFLLFRCLNIEVSKDHVLSYECREKSDKILEALATETPINETIAKYTEAPEEVESSILQGVQVILHRLAVKGKEWEGKLRASLPQIRLYRVVVPDGTDLNRYFEIMNTRGEQLRPEDVIKARMMSVLVEDKDSQELFSDVWDACSQMDGYVQAYLSKRRELFFGERWTDWQEDVWRKVNMKKMPGNVRTGSVDGGRPSQSGRQGDALCELWENINVKGDEKRFSKDRDVGSWGHFESIVDFPHFLLHVLRIYCKTRGMKTDGRDKWWPSLDDTRLTSVFDEVGFSDVKSVMAFAKCLLKCRYLFDNFIVKREFDYEGDEDGDWSLKCLARSSPQDGSSSLYYKFTFGDEASDEEKNLMLQTCLRVSYTDQKGMNWITRLLLYLDGQAEIGIDPGVMSQKTEEILQEAVRETDFWKNGEYAQGVATPHVVLNYLDYLLWDKEKNSDFQFGFRTTVEHWYPQHPSEDMYDDWETVAKNYPNEDCGTVDRFGNLCIMYRKNNSKFSNLSPKAKSESYPKTVESGSLKLRKMAAIVENMSKHCKEWVRSECAKHEQEMLGLLRTALSKEIPSKIDA